MKKILAVAAVVCVVCVAGAAFAQQPGQAKKRLDQRRGPQFAQQMPQPGQQGQRQPEMRMFQPGQQGQPGQFRPCDCGRFEERGPRGPEFEGRGPRGMMFAPDMPEEIKAKAVEAAKLHVDLEAALSAKPIDKAKALEVFTQIQKAEQEIEAWKFAKRIERIEAFRTQQELNRKAAAAKDAPKPETPAPAPEAPAPADKAE